MFFKLVGWDFAESGARPPDFAEMFQALGVVINVSALQNGLVTISNTESRRNELIQSLLEILKERRLTRHEALKLRGRLQFAAGNIFGRVAKRALSVVAWHAYGCGTPKLDDKAIMALRLHVKLLELGRPRELRPSSNSVWFLQTDASYEPSDDGTFSGIGAVLFYPLCSFSRSSCLVTWYSPWILLAKRMLSSSANFSLFSAPSTFGVMWSPMQWWYTDNNAVRDALIAGHTINGLAKRILVATFGLECEKQLTPWYARVPIDSNMADGPSRLKVERVLELGACVCDVDASQCWAALLAYAGR